MQGAHIFAIFDVRCTFHGGCDSRNTTALHIYIISTFCGDQIVQVVRMGNIRAISCRGRITSRSSTHAFFMARVTRHPQNTTAYTIYKTVAGMLLQLFRSLLLRNSSKPAVANIHPMAGQTPAMLSRPW